VRDSAWEKAPRESGRWVPGLSEKAVQHPKYEFRVADSKYRSVSLNELSPEVRKSEPAV
jgi:hypothetical protein